MENYSSDYLKKFIQKIGYLCLLVITSCNAIRPIAKIQQFAPIEELPDDSILQREIIKKALVIVAHDDDICQITGTLSKLNKNGWEIRILSIPQDSARNAFHIKACQHIADTVVYFNFNYKNYRNDLDTVKFPYLAMDKMQFPLIYREDLIVNDIIEITNQFKPSVIFTLDNEIGGYGHPDHVYISQRVLDLSHSRQIQPKYIYQSVYTKHMETSIMDRHMQQMKNWGFEVNEWEWAKTKYKVQGMPAPTVQLNIESEAKNKMDYLRSYSKRVRQVIDFYVPYFDDYSADRYFAIFNREFYRVISF